MLQLSERIGWMKLVIQIPCLNEEDSLPVTLADLPKQVPGIDEIDIVIIDDGSTDKTVEVAKSFGVKNIVHFSTNKGLAKAFLAGIGKSLDIGADIIINTDADNQYCAKDIEKLVQPILEGRADIVIGTRPVSEIKHFSPLKKFLQKFGSWVMRLLSSTKVEDAPSGFRAFSREAAIQLNVFDNYSYTLETILQAKVKGLNIECVDINVNPELRKSRLFSNMFTYILRSVFTMIRMFIIYRPFRFFAVCGLIFLLIGLILSGRFIYYFLMGTGQGHIQSLIFAAVFLLTGVQIGLIAVLADLISINRKLLEDIQKRVKLDGLQKKSDDLK